ncbi:hypothetical protein SLS53_005088 [Cytospora paraplurivora]|uniref:Uncharacterized protein n=1 Tax=Cytospora paraplurivora TaxID=2898453 RepID=A0AAN9YGJ9_9PEZI
MALAFTRTVEYHEPSVKVIQIDLEKDVIDASNRHFQHYQQAMQAMQASQGRNLDKAAVRGRSHLIRARLWLYHPGSVDLQDCGKSPTERSLILKGFSEANGDRVLLARGGKDILARSLPCATDFDPVPLGKPVVGGES